MQQPGLEIFLRTIVSLPVRMGRLSSVRRLTSLLLPWGLAGGSANLAAALGLASTATTISMNNSESINNINVTTVGNANLAILAVEQGINTLNNAQAYLGAVVNRFNSAVAELQSDSTNITSARSTFMDADYAASTSNLTTALITEQAGI